MEGFAYNEFNPDTVELVFVFLDILEFTEMF